MRHLILILILTLACAQTVAQINELDQSDSIYVSQLITEAHAIKFKDTQQAEKLAVEAVTLANANGHLALEAKAWQALGFIYWDRGEYGKSLKCDSASLKIFEFLNDTIHVAQTIMGMGVTNYDLRKNDLALRHYLEAQDLFRTVGRDTSLAYLYLNIGLIFNDCKDYRNARRYLDMALQVVDSLELITERPHVIHNLGVHYLTQDSAKRALPFFDEALDEYELNGEYSSMSFVLNNRGIAYSKLEDFESAERDYLRALSLARDYEDLAMYSFALANTGRLRLEQGHHSEAQLLLDSALRYSERMGFIEDQQLALQGLGNLHKELGNPALSFEYMDRYYAMMDSTESSNSAISIASTAALYESQKKDRTHLADLHQLELEQAETKTLFITLLVIAGFILVFAIALWFVLRTIRLKNKELVTMVSLLHERTHQAEEARKAKSEFLSRMSHEFKTPLTSIIGLSELMQLKSGDQLSEEIALLRFSADNLLHLIKDLLDLNKLEAGKITLEKAPINLEGLLVKIVGAQKPMADEKDLELLLQIDSNVPHGIIGDQYRLAQVLNNLVNNAIKFTFNGYVKITANTEMKDHEKWLVIEVADSGIGIKKNVQSSVFESFTQSETSTARKFGGSGLGLSIVRNLVDLMDGEVKLTSQEGHGTSVRLWLPLEIAKGDVGVIDPKLSAKGILTRVLVVDDNALNQTITKKLLQTAGIANIDQALSGKEALLLCQSNDYDAVLMDIEMPEMDGFETARKIHELNNETRIIAFSATGKDEILAHKNASHFSKVITKPSTSQELIEKIHE